MFKSHRSKPVSSTMKRGGESFRPLHLEALERRDLLSFVPGPTFLAGPTPVALAATDFDGNGSTDLAVVNGVPNGTVTVMRGTGTGIFRPAFRGKAGPSPYDLAVGDFNSDGAPDVAAVNFQNSSISVLTGSSNGISYSESYPTQEHPFFIAVGDFNEDDVQDLAVTHNVAGGSVEIFLGIGNNEFVPALVLAAGDNPTAVAVADVNADGHEDLTVGNYHVGEVLVFRGRGDGSFMSPLVQAAGHSIDDLTIVDVDHDENLDIVALNGEPVGGIMVLLGNGDGTFRDEFGKQDANAGHPRSLAIADFNHDGNVDVAVAAYDNVAVSVLLGNGDGQYQSPLTYPLPAAPRDIAAGDFDNDGFVDLAVPAPTLGVTIIRNAADWMPVPPLLVHGMHLESGVAQAAAELRAIDHGIDSHLERNVEPLVSAWIREPSRQHHARRLERQQNSKTSAVSWWAFDFDAAAVVLHDAVADAQA